MNRIEFDSKNHIYTLYKDDEKIKDLISVTQLLEKHGLSPDYSRVNSDLLSVKADRGNIIHEELSDYILHKNVGFTGELEAFIDACKEKKILPSKSEFQVWNDELAGTVDVAGIIDGQTFIGDFKTTATLHREAVAWQLSLYAHLMNETFDKYLCFHFPDANTCKVVEIELISKDEIERLLECERNFELYQRKTLDLDIKTCESLLQVQLELKKLDEQKKALECVELEIKEFLIKKMEDTGVKSIDNEFFKITYTAPTTRETIDSGRLKAEMPDIAKQFMKTSRVKAQVRITLKKAE